MVRAGEKLKPGDLLSLGSLKAVPPQAGQTITVRYEGLPAGPIKASIHFR
jgi:2-keto-4-pentenoate hydratase